MLYFILRVQVWVVSWFYMLTPPTKVDLLSNIPFTKLLPHKVWDEVTLSATSIMWKFQWSAMWTWRMYYILNLLVHLICPCCYTTLLLCCMIRCCSASTTGALIKQEVFFESISKFKQWVRYGIATTSTKQTLKVARSKMKTAARSPCGWLLTENRNRNCQLLVE